MFIDNRVGCPSAFQKEREGIARCLFKLQGTLSDEIAWTKHQANHFRTSLSESNVCATKTWHRHTLLSNNLG
jgi:hypothetical protein